MQERFWNEIEARRKSRLASASQFDAEQVTVHCRSCKRRLCAGTDMRQRGSNFICADEDFIDSVTVRLLDNQEDFRAETHLGNLFQLPSC